MKETWVQSLGLEDPLEKEIASHSIILPGKLYEQRSLVGYSPWGCKQSDKTECAHTHTHTICYIFIIFTLLPWWLRGKASACNAGDLGSTPGSGRSPGEGNGKPLRYSCLKNPMDREAW